MKIQDRITAIEGMTDYLLHKVSKERVTSDKSIVTIDCWLKRTQGNTKRAELVTERYIVEDYDTVDEQVWKDDLNFNNTLQRFKKW